MNTSPNRTTAVCFAWIWVTGAHGISCKTLTHVASRHPRIERKQFSTPIGPNGRNDDEAPTMFDLIIGTDFADEEAEVEEVGGDLSFLTEEAKDEDEN